MREWLKQRPWIWLVLFLIADDLPEEALQNVRHLNQSGVPGWLLFGLLLRGERS